MDEARIGYLGMSLGAIVGTIGVAMDEDIAAAVLNVGAVGIIDILEHTASDDLRCLLVDGLIDAGELEGISLAESRANSAAAATCLTDDWRQSTEWQDFANVARWIVDPAEPANFVERLRGRPILLQEVSGDELIPNFSMARLAELLELDTGISEILDESSLVVGPQMSQAVAQQAPGSLRMRYVNAQSFGQFVGNTYSHASLLTPPEPAACNDEVNCLDGALGTAQMRADAFGFLLEALGVPTL